MIGERLTYVPGLGLRCEGKEPATETDRDFLGSMESAYQKLEPILSSLGLGQVVLCIQGNLEHQAWEVSIHSCGVPAMEHFAMLTRNADLGAAIYGLGIMLHETVVNADRYFQEGEEQQESP